MSSARQYTCLLLERIEEGDYDKDQVIMACTKYMSEDDVHDMMDYNEMLEDDPFGSPFCQVTKELHDERVREHANEVQDAQNDEVRK